MKSSARLVSALAVVLVWLFVAASIVRGLAPLFERMFTERSSDFDQPSGPSLFAWLVGFALLIGCVTAWRVARAEPRDANLRGLRSSLSVWPGWLLSIFGVLAAGAALSLSGRSSAVMDSALSLFDNDVFLTVPLTLAGAAAATGVRSTGAAAFLAAPMVLLLSVALVGEISIVRLTAAAFIPSIALTSGFTAIALVTGRELFVWLASGFALAAAVALLLATGLFTPTEVLGLVGGWALTTGLLIHTLFDGAFPWRVFAIGATEILAVAAALVLAALVSILARVHGLVPQPVTAATSLELIAVAAVLVAGYLVTPTPAVALLGIVLLKIFDEDRSIRVGVLLGLAGVTAMVLRMIEWTPSKKAESSLLLSRAAGLIAVAMLLTVTVLTIVFWDNVSQHQFSLDCWMSRPRVDDCQDQQTR
jgi:hypothetical protein